MNAESREKVLTDADLVGQILEGEASRFDELVRRHLGSLVGFFRYLHVKPEILDDMVQETFLKALRKLTSFDRKKPFSTWLLTIGKHTCIDHFRKNAREKKNMEGDTSPVATESPENQIVTRQTLETVLATLPEDAKLLLELRIYKQLPFSEIAETLEESEIGVRVKFHRLLKILRERAGKELHHEQ